MIDKIPAKIKEVLTRGVEEVIVRESLEKKLKSGKVLRIKYGIDPTAPDIHLGHAVNLWKLKEFQDRGHKIIFLVGDFTARIGDPSAKLSSRKPLSVKEVELNMKNYLRQVASILNMKKVEVCYNSQWLSKLSLKELFPLIGLFTYNQMIERDMFQERIKKHKPVWIHELMYPILQGYDSMVLKADLEIGGTDQTFNMLAARTIQPHYKQEPQNIITLKLLVGTDGKQKMSQSLDNYISITEEPNEQYGKVMSIPDHLIIPWFELATRLPLTKVDKIKKELKASKVNPRDAKARLAREIVTIYHGTKKAKEAEKEFEKVFKNKEKPTQIKASKPMDPGISTTSAVVYESGMAPSKSEARRLIQQKAVEIDGVKIDDWAKEIDPYEGMEIQVGKHKFCKIKIKRKK